MPVSYDVFMAGMDWQGRIDNTFFLIVTLYIMQPIDTCLQRYIRYQICFREIDDTSKSTINKLFQADVCLANELASMHVYIQTIYTSLLSSNCVGAFG